MRLNSSHSYVDRGNDFYPTPIEAIQSLIEIEGARMPHTIWEPACGDGAIVKPLERSGRQVVATDLIDYGAGYCGHVNFLDTLCPSDAEGIVTNPPYKLASQFVEKAIREAPYSAFLLRINFLESIRRYDFWKQAPLARVLVSSRRLPTMHRHGWEGPKAPSNMLFAWFVFEKDNYERKIEWFDWADYKKEFSCDIH
ncbi:MAG: hypothetical protein KGI54_16405 [Pseudomonadota bacterium]|nr:hypothetical protein [Pseudomonadota bacterium]